MHTRLSLWDWWISTFRVLVWEFNPLIHRTGCSDTKAVSLCHLKLGLNLQQHFMDPERRSHIVLNVSLWGERQGQKEGSSPLVLSLKDPRPTARNSILVSHLGGRHRSIWVRNVHEQKDWMKSRAEVQTQATRCRTRAPNWSLTHQAKSLVLTAVKDTNRVPILAGSYLPSSSLDSPRKAKLIVPYWPTNSAYIWFASTLFFKKKKS